MLLFCLEEAVGKKPLPQPYSLDKAMHVIQAGATEVRLDLEANMDAKLAFLIMDVATQRHVVGLELLCSVTGNIFDLCNFSLLTVARRRGLYSGSAMECQSR